jgi:alpha-galactosidase
VTLERLAADVRGKRLLVRGRRGRTILDAHAEVLLGDGQLATWGSGVLGWVVEPHDTGILVRLAFRNAGDGPVSLEQLRPLVARLGGTHAQTRVRQTGWQSWSLAESPMRFAPNPDSMPPPVRGPLLPHRLRGGLAVPWVVTLGEDTNGWLLLGFTRAAEQTGVVEIAPAERHWLVRAAVELEGVALPPGGEVASEPLLILRGSDESELLDVYSGVAGEAMHARVPGQPPAGWCSWYQFGAEVTEHDIRRNMTSLDDQRQRLPVQVIQVDDGYQRAVGDWLDVRSEAFPSGLAALAREIRTHGFQPGLWLAPFLLSAHSRTYREHPDWVVTDAHGQPLNALDNWGAPNYALDSTNPEALAWLEDVLRTIVHDWAFEYLKLDFLYAGALRGRRHEPSVNSVQAYRRGLELIRWVAGERYLLGCGAPLLASVGLVDAMRIGSDVAPWWRRTGPGPATENALRATLARLWLHGRWWANDPDCVLARAHQTELTGDEIRAWASVVALSGGLVVLGDDVSALEPERAALVARLLPSVDQAAGMVAGRPDRMRLRIRRAWASWQIVALANWTDAPARDLVFDPAEWHHAGAFHLVDLWSGAHSGPHVGAVVLGDLAPHALKLLSVHPADTDRPHVVGSTGHLLGEAMDVLDEYWDGRTLHVSLAGRHHGELLVARPVGRVERVAFRSGQGTARIELSACG